MKGDENLFTGGLQTFQSIKYKNTHMHRRSHRDASINAKHTTEVILLNVCFFSFLTQRMSKFEKQMESCVIIKIAHDQK